LLSVHVFPLISKMLVNSEEQVQTEGVDALLKVCKENIDREEAQFLIFHLVQMIMLNIDQCEGAKVAVMIVYERFSEAGLFEQEHCTTFLTTFLPELQRGMLFKIKKFLIPTFIQISRHIPYEMFISSVFSQFMAFSTDDIWGVRKICIEKLQEIIKLLKPQESHKLISCIDFLQVSLSDSSRWVKNQAFQVFGPVIYEIFLKN
jgi:hypothetical protein